MSPGTIDIEPVPTPPAPPVLKYLFGAHLAGGGEIFQQPDDQSRISEGRNCYYDLLEHDADGAPLYHPVDDAVLPRQDIELFQLHEPSWLQDPATGNRWLVDLRDGHFEANQARFWISYPPLDQNGHPKKLLLVFFRRVRKHIESRVLGGKIISQRQIAEEVEYHIGWSTADKTVTETLIIT